MPLAKHAVVVRKIQGRLFKQLTTVWFRTLLGNPKIFRKKGKQRNVTDFVKPPILGHVGTEALVSASHLTEFDARLLSNMLF
jgi:hypothetical protein